MGVGEARSADGESTNPDLEGLQAGCSDSVLRKGIPDSNGPGPGVERKFPVVGSGEWDLDSVAVLSQHSYERNSPSSGCC